MLLLRRKRRLLHAVPGDRGRRLWRPRGRLLLLHAARVLRHELLLMHLRRAAKVRLPILRLPELLPELLLWLLLRLCVHWHLLLLLLHLIRWLPHWRLLRRSGITKRVECILRRVLPGTRGRQRLRRGCILWAIKVGVGGATKRGASENIVWIHAHWIAEHRRGRHGCVRRRRCTETDANIELHKQWQ